MLKNISGFPEFLPREQIAFNQMIAMIKKKFESYGFAPLETPAVERTATLLAKGNDTEIYGIHRLADTTGAEKKELALRFDLTVPLARYVAQHYSQLTFPYRRYHIAPVWRGERPQAGRYRQFYQCDIDIIGDGVLSLFHDAEALSLIYQVFTAMGLDQFVIHINHTGMLTGLIQSFGISGHNIAVVMRIIDKADKMTPDSLERELYTHGGLNHQHIHILLDLISRKMSDQQAWLNYLAGLCTENIFHQSLAELQAVLKHAKSFGIPDECLQVTPALARGLNYYTGTVAEVRLLNYPALGSVCGGGRYDNLAGVFSSKQLPGVGFSIGISRLLPLLMQMGLIKTDAETPAQVLVTTQNPDFMSEYINCAQLLRQQGINTELYLADKPLGAQMKYASKKGIDFAIIASSPEFQAKKVILRHMKTGEQSTIALAEAMRMIQQGS